MPVAPSFALCTPEEVRAEIGNDSEAIADRIQLAINTASLWAEWKTGRQFRKFDHAASPFKVRDGDDLVFGRSLFLPWPIITLTAVKEDGVTLTAEEHYRVKRATPGDALAEVLRIGTDWRVMESTAIELTGVFGWNWTAATDAAPPEGIPFNVRRAVRLVAAAMTGENERESISPDGARLAYIDKRVPAEAHQLLAALRPSF